MSQSHCQNCPFFLKMTQSCPVSSDFYSSPSLFETLMVIFSVIPYCLGLVVCMKFLVTRTARGSLLFFLLVAQNAVGETLKNFIMQPRPEGACSKSFGMPSSHSVMIGGLGTWLFLEEIGFEKWVVFKDTPRRKLLNIGCWTLMPLVCYSRVFLGYHSWQQVACGTIMGICDATLLFIVTLKSAKKAEKLRFAGRLPIIYRIWDWAMIKVDLHPELFYVRQFKAENSDKPRPSRKMEQLARAFSEASSIKNDIEKQKDFLQKISGISNILGENERFLSETTSGEAKNKRKTK